jgi:hypothetical protein
MYLNLCPLAGRWPDAVAHGDSTRTEGRGSEARSAGTGTLTHASPNARACSSRAARGRRHSARPGRRHRPVRRHSWRTRAAAPPPQAETEGAPACRTRGATPVGCRRTMLPPHKHGGPPFWAEGLTQQRGEGAGGRERTGIGEVGASAEVRLPAAAAPSGRALSTPSAPRQSAGRQCRQEQKHKRA